MSDFTKELSRLRAGSFLGGLAKLGEAVKEERQHESLVETYNKFKAEKEGLLTTQEAITGANKRTSLLELPTGKEIPSDVKQTINFLGNLENIKAYQDLYQPYIDAFLTLGDEGVKLAGSLSEQLADKITLEEKKGELPFRELKWLELEQQYNWNLNQYQEYLFNNEQRKEIQGIAEYMMSTDIFGSLPTGKNRYHSISERNRITELENNVLRDAKTQFPNMKDGSVSTALKIAKDLSGREYSYIELTPAQLKAGEAPAIAYGGYLSSLQAWSERWLGMNEGYRNAVKTYMSKGGLPEKDLVSGQSPYDIERIKKDAEIYGSTGLYMNAWTIMTSTGSPFTDLKDFEDIITDGNKSDTPKNRSYKSLLYPTENGRFFNSFIDGNFRYNPASANFTIAEQQKRMKEILENDEIPIGDTESTGEVLEDIFGEREGTQGGALDKAIFEFFTGGKK